MADLTAKGIRFNVQRLGEGKATVVFIHGLVMDNLSSFYFTFAHPVACFAQVVLYDLKGHGLSERPTSGYRIDDMIEELSALLDAMAIEGKVYLVGNSFGGLVALSFALAHPDRVGGLCLIDSLWNAKGWCEDMTKTLSLEGDALVALIGNSFKSWLGRHSAKKSTRLERAARALIHGTSLVEDLAASSILDEDAVAGINCPMLLIYGEHSDMRPVGEKIVGKAAHARLEIIQGCSHSVMWEATEKVRDILLSWLAGSCR